MPNNLRFIEKKSVENGRSTNLLPILEETEEGDETAKEEEEEEAEEEEEELLFDEDHYQTTRNDFQEELKDLEFIEQDFFSFVLPWLKLIPEGASVPLEEVRVKEDWDFNSDF